MSNWDIAHLVLLIVWFILMGIGIIGIAKKNYLEEKELRHIRKLREELEKKIEEFNKNE